MERFTKPTIGCFKYDLKDHTHVVGEFTTYDAFFNYSMAVKKLGEYEDLEEQGRLIQLPCAVGDTVYKIPSRVNRELNIISGHKEANRVYEQKVCRIEVYEGGVYLLITCDGIDALHSRFYKYNWFLTRAEAEAALAATSAEEMEDADG